jgi:DNA-binding NarL/FixJ family response regulator
MARILIAEDEEGLRSLVARALMLDGHDVITANDGAEALELIVRTQGAFDLLLTDIRMPVMDGIEATSHLVAREDAPKVIVLTTFDADDFVMRALAAGASGFLLKDTAPADIVDAIHKVAAGEPMLSPSVTSTLIHQVTAGQSPDRGAALARLERLTERERDVALAVGRGLSNAEIAKELYLSVPTVKAHIGRLFAKLEVENRVQIALCVHDAGLG